MLGCQCHSRGWQLLWLKLKCSPSAGGDVRGLDFRFFLGDKKIGAPFHGLKAFFTTPQLNLLDKVRLKVVLYVCCRGLQQSADRACSLSLHASVLPEQCKTG